MGMYDEITCEYPLPGEPPAFVRGAGHRFQTKDLDCELATYAITAGGELRFRGASWPDRPATDAPVPHHGEIEFHDSNICAVHGEIVETRDGSDAESVTYVATFDRGRLTGIVEAGRERRKAVKSGSLDGPDEAPGDEDRARWDRMERESLVGRTMFCHWGGREVEEGYPVEIVAEGPHQWVGRKPDDHLELFERRFHRGRILFDSEAEAQAERDGTKAEYAAKLARFREMNGTTT